MTGDERVEIFMNSPIHSMIPPEFKTYLYSNGFFTAPASTKYHGSYEGGLFDHSLEVMNTLVYLTENCQLDWARAESPYLVGMFHDLCKIDQYKGPLLTNDLNGGPLVLWEYREDTLLKGHGDKSVMLLAQFMALTTEEVMCIRYHMGAFTEKEQWRDFTGAVKAYPNVLWTHQADMIASHVVEI